MKSYICDKCNQVVRIKKYSCIECNQNYSTKSNLNRHVKTVHEVKKSNILDDVNSTEFNKGDILISNDNGEFNSTVKNYEELVENKKSNDFILSGEEEIQQPKSRKKAVKKFANHYNKEILKNLIWKYCIIT